MPIYGMRAVSSIKRNSLFQLVGELFLIRAALGLCTWGLFLFAFRYLQLSDPALLFIFGVGILGAIPECEWLFKGMESYSDLLILSTVFRLLGIAALLLFVRQASDLFIYAWITVIMGVGINLAEAVYAGAKWELQIFKSCKDIICSGKVAEAFRKHLMHLVLFFLMSCAVTIYSHSDTVMLGILKGDADVGIYACAARVKLLLPVISGALWAASLPKSAKLWKDGNISAFKTLSDYSFHVVQTLLLPLVFYFIVFAGPCVSFLGGLEYTEAVGPMRILLLAVIPIGFSNIAGGQLLIPMGEEKKLFLAEGIGAGANIVMNAVLIPSLGAAGAAIATTLSELMVAVITVYYAGKKAHIQILDWKPLKHFIPGCIAAGISGAVLWTGWKDIVKLMVSALIFGAIYASVMLALKDEIFLDMFSSAKNIYRQLCPAGTRMKIRYGRRQIRAFGYRAKGLISGGDTRYLCPCCKTNISRFVSGGFMDHPDTYDPDRYVNVVQEVICPVCGALPRHRILAAWCDGHQDEIKGRILYFAMEDSMRMWFERNHIRVTTADLYQAADLRLDIQDTGEPAGSWDWIFCNHVLEHVPDYKKALRELHRILKPGGKLICSFPIDESYETLIENPNAGESDRIVRFGQSDHLRVFGRDSEQILSRAGFKVSRIEGAESEESIMPVVGPADYDVNYLFLCEMM